MIKFSKEEWFSIISTIITIILTIFKNETNEFVIIPIIVLLVAIIIVSLIVSKTKANKNLTNTAVISKSKKYTKMLSVLVKENAKVLKKYSGSRGFKRLERTNKLVISKVQGKKKPTDEQLKDLRLKLANDLDDYYTKKEIKDRYKAIRKQIPYCTEEQAYKVHKIIYKNVKDLRRILLQLEQHELRIKLGNYVVKYSFDIMEQINSYIDDIGWTHFLLGDNKKGAEAVRIAINLIDYKVENLKNKGLDADEVQEYYTLLMLKSRALRHLGTTYYTYKTEGVKVGEHLEKAKKICDNKKFKEYYLNTTENNKKTYYSMVHGLDYNLMLFNFYEHLKNKDLSDDGFKKMYEEVDELIDNLKQEKSYDKHRLVKLLTFRSQVYNEIVDPQFRDEHEDTIEHDLSTIESVLNGNIYFDEALEAYLHQKVEKVYDDVNEVFKH